MFEDRSEAGRRLGSGLMKYRGSDVVVEAIPRGGVVIGQAVAAALKAPLDVIIPRKLGAPGNPELGFGAVAEGGVTLLNDVLVDQLGITDEYIAKEKRVQMEAVKRRHDLYRGGRPPIPVQGKIAILVDDGLATGFTAMAAAAALRKLGPRRLVLAIPVAPSETLARFTGLVDEIVCLFTPRLFYAVGQFYEDFMQVSDDEVVEVLRTHHEDIRGTDPTDRRGAA